MEENKTNKSGTDLIAEERIRQITGGGYSWRHDDQETAHQLSNAAIIQSNEINSEFKGQKIIHRIKPESQYRPFENQEECWNEMLKHQPFGWLKVKTDGRYRFISELGSLSVLLTKVVTVTPFHESIPYSTTMFGVYTFADGTPFGVKI